MRRCVERTGGPAAACVAALLCTLLCVVGCGPDEVVTIGQPDAAPAPRGPFGNAPAVRPSAGSNTASYTGSAGGTRPSGGSPTVTDAGAMNRRAAADFESFAQSLPPGERNLAATVVVTGVDESIPGAVRFVRSKLSSAAGKFFNEATAGSRARTEANRTAAEKRAIAESQMWYRYRRADPEISGTRVAAGPAGDGTHVFYVFPVRDPDRLGGMVDPLTAVSVDRGSRTVTLAADLPDPPADAIRTGYPADRVVRVVLRHLGTGSDWDREAWLELETRKLGELSLLDVGGHTWDAEPGTLVYSVAPVNDVEAFAAKIPYGDVTRVDGDARTVEVSVRLPADLPGWIDTRRAERDLEKQRGGSAVAGADSTGGPRWSSDREAAEGETQLDWALRVIAESDDTFAKRDAYEFLQTAPPTDADRARVGEVLIAALPIVEWTRFEEHANALINWKPDGYLRALGKALALSDGSIFDKRRVLKTLQTLDDPAAAEAIVAVLEDRSLADEAVTALRWLGPKAEHAVIPLLRDPDPGMRRDAAGLLVEIGTSESLGALSTASRVESNALLKRHLRAARVALRKRLVDAGATDL